MSTFTSYPPLCTIKQIIVANLEAPRLKGVYTADIIEFMCERTIYELAVGDKNKYHSKNIVEQCYNASVEKNQLTVFISRKWVTSTKVYDVRDDDLKKCFENITKRESYGSTLHLMDEAVKKVKMDMTIPEPENRILFLKLKYLHVLEASGFSDLSAKKSKISIGHLLKPVCPIALRRSMANVIKWREKWSKRDQFPYS